MNETKSPTYHKIIADLNKEQKAAVLKTDGPVRILARSR